MEACARCGAFAELQQIAAARYCAACAARPEIGDAEKFRAAHLGKRDVYAWLIVSLAPIALWAAFSGTAQGNRPYALICLCLAAAQIFFWMGFPWARPLPFIAAAIGFGVFVPTNTGQALGFLVPIVFASAAWLNPVCQLFFHVKVPEWRLRRTVERLQHNELSHTASVLAGASLLVPLLWPLALGYSIAALSRVDSNATPPIGRGLALRALFAVLVSPVFFIALFIALYQVFQRTGS